MNLFAKQTSTHRENLRLTERTYDYGNGAMDKLGA